MVLSGHEQRRRTARRRLILVVAAAAALVVGGVIAVAAMTGSSSTSTDSAAPRRLAATSPSSSPSSDAGVGPSGAGLLPGPRRVVSGVPVGYPHTELGAVSAAAHYFEVFDLFDPEAAQEQARVMAQPGFADAFALQAKASAERVRAAAGLPPTGTSDNANYSASQARAYRIVEKGPERTTVWLLMKDTTSAKGIGSSSTQVQGAAMVWAAGDWHIGVNGRIRTPPEPVEPDSPQAEREGWVPLAYEK